MVHTNYETNVHGILIIIIEDLSINYRGRLSSNYFLTYQKHLLDLLEDEQPSVDSSEEPNDAISSMKKVQIIVCTNIETKIN